MQLVELGVFLPAMIVLVVSGCIFTRRPKKVHKAPPNRPRRKPPSRRSAHDVRFSAASPYCFQQARICRRRAPRRRETERHNAGSQFCYAARRLDPSIATILYFGFAAWAGEGDGL